MNETENGTANTERNKRYGVIAGITVLIAMIIIIPTVVVTTNKNKKDNDAAAIEGLTTEQVTMLTTACNFLSISSLSSCLKVTSYDGRTTGATIPTEIGVLTQLTYLDLDENQLTGTIPSTMGNLTRLNELDLSENRLVGTIPVTLGNLIQLTELDLDDNQLTGTIPSTLGNLIQLDELELALNQLNGTVPATLEQLSVLDELTLYGNSKLNGSISSSMCSLSSGKVEIRIDCGNINCTCCTSSDGVTSC